MIRIKRFNSGDPDFDQSLEKLLAFEETEDESVRTAVSAILADIKKRGDEALLEYTQRFDRLEAMAAAELELPLGRIEEALRRLPGNERRALEQAAMRVRAYHEKQLAHSWSYTEPDGTLLGQKITPLDCVGLYVPGGKASYPSSVLMNAIPAKVAGVDELIMVVPAPGGETSDLVLAAAGICGVDRVFTIGGAQAVGALAYGTQTVPQVDKIVGPGNAYVAADGQPHSAAARDGHRRPERDQRSLGAVAQRTSPGCQVGSPVRGRQDARRMAQVTQRLGDPGDVLVHVVRLRPRERGHQANSQSHDVPSLVRSSSAAAERGRGPVAQPPSVLRISGTTSGWRLSVSPRRASTS